MNEKQLGEQLTANKGSDAEMACLLSRPLSRLKHFMHHKIKNLAKNMSQFKEVGLRM